MGGGGEEIVDREEHMKPTSARVTACNTLLAVSFATVLALAAAFVYCGFQTNLNLSAHDVGGAKV